MRPRAAILPALLFGVVPSFAASIPQEMPVLDKSGREVAVTLASGQLLRYTYRPNGRCVWDQEGNLIAFEHTSGAVAAYAYDRGDLIETRLTENKANSFIQAKHAREQPDPLSGLRFVRLVWRDPTGGLVGVGPIPSERRPLGEDYEAVRTSILRRAARPVHTQSAFGGGGSIGGGSQNAFGFTGHVHDPETELIYMKARYYDPTIGRFITQDTNLGDPTDPMSLNRYLYAHANPTRYVDPYGHERVEVPIDPNSKGAKAAESIRQRYNEAYQKFKDSSAAAAEAARRLEESKRYRLNVEYDPTLPKDTAARVTNYVFDGNGTVTEATLLVGRSFGKQPDKDKYTSGSQVKSGERPLYTVGHEEQGHFMLTVDDVTQDPTYLAALKTQEAVRQQLIQIEAEARRIAGAGYQAEVSKVRQRLGVEPIAETVKRQQDLETAADKVGVKYVDEARKETAARKNKPATPPGPSTP